MQTSLTARPSKPIAELSRMIGIPDLTLAHDGSCQLLFDRTHLVTLVVVPALNKLVLSCPCPTKGLDPTRLAHLALRANFMGCGSAGASFALGPDDRMHLQCQLPLPALTSDGLMSAIEGLLNSIDSWSVRLRPEMRVSPPASAVLAPQRA